MEFFDKIEKKLMEYPVYVKILKIQYRVSEAFLKAVRHVWNFLFAKTPDTAERLNSDKKDEQLFERFKQKYKRFKKKLADFILTALMAFFNAVGPVWNFLCTKTLNPDGTNDSNNEISLDVIKLLC